MINMILINVKSFNLEILIKTSFVWKNLVEITVLDREVLKICARNIFSNRDFRNFHQFSYDLFFL